MSTNDERQYTLRAMWGMVIVAIIALVSLTKAYNGEIARIAIYGIIILVLGEAALEYYFSKKKEPKI